jgi:hypothetical protein
LVGTRTWTSRCLAVAGGLPRLVLAPLPLVVLLYLKLLLPIGLPYKFWLETAPSLCGIKGFACLGVHLREQKQEQAW